MLDTTLVPEADRFDLWTEFCVGANPTRIAVDAEGPFDAYAQLVDLDGVLLTSFRYPTLRLIRTARHVRQADPEHFYLALPLVGQSAITQSRTTATIERTGFTFFDTSRPYEAAHRADEPQPTSTICLQIPHTRLPLPAAVVNRLLAATMPADRGMGVLLAQLVRQVAEHPEQYGPEDAGTLGNTVMDLVTAVLARHADAEGDLAPETRHRATRLRIESFVERRLADPALDPAAIAAAHHISLRTLHRLFAADGETVHQSIRRRRLERCRRDLRSPLLAGQPIGLIAARWGFTDPAHFSRSFRAAYGVSARDYRAGAAPTTVPDARRYADRTAD